MITKLAGAVLVAGCSSALGFCSAASLSKRVNILRAILRCLETLKSELIFNMTPMEDILRKLERDPILGEMFMNMRKEMDQLGDVTFENIWWNNTQRHLTDVEAEEREVFADLGRNIAAYAGECQINSLDSCIESMKTYLDDAKEAKESQGKIYGAMGILSGIAAVVVLI